MMPVTCPGSMRNGNCHQRAKQPPSSHSREPRHGCICWIFFQETEPSSNPRLPPLAPIAREEAPADDELLKSKACEIGPFAPCGAKVFPPSNPGDQSLMSV